MLHFDTDDSADILYSASRTALVTALRHCIPHIRPQTWHSSTHLFVRFSCPLQELLANEAFSEYAYTDFSLRQWLRCFPIAHKIYWRNREQTYEVAGCGIAHCIEGSNADISSLLRLVHDATEKATPNIRYYGGMRFYEPSKDDPVWQGFPDAAFILPFLECDCAEDVIFLHCTVALPLGKSVEEARTKALQELRTLEAHIERAAKKAEETSYEDISGTITGFKSISYAGRTNVPTEEQWEQSIQAALKEFAGENLEKVVLARRVTLHTSPEIRNGYEAHNLQHEYPSDIDSLGLFQERLRKAQHATAFYLQLGTDSVFFGTTPELLYQREGRTISTEAIAGTRQRGASQEEDEEIAEELFHSDKDRREHASVQRFIASALDDLTESFTIGTVELLKLPNVQHLYAVFTGKLRPESDDAAILKYLHPTPAVGGTPRRAALNFLQKHEGFDRGWYAAPVGWVNAHAAEFVVAIRSALVSGATVHIFSGAGIVAGSEADKEWQEIEMKIAPLLELFHHKPQHHSSPKTS